jgi:hypothetical protein
VAAQIPQVLALAAEAAAAPAAAAIKKRLTWYTQYIKIKLKKLNICHLFQSLRVFQPTDSVQGSKTDRV